MKLQLIISSVIADRIYYGSTRAFDKMLPNDAEIVSKGDVITFVAGQQNGTYHPIRNERYMVIGKTPTEEGYVRLDFAHLPHPGQEMYD